MPFEAFVKVEPVWVPSDVKDTISAIPISEGIKPYSIEKLDQFAHAPALSMYHALPLDDDTSAMLTSGIISLAKVTRSSDRGGHELRR